ncbi:hypothetical protein [Methylobacterium persicinum]|uniref:Membrane protein YhiD involved in acid resistance n=1 Tax=Methylobacterium persicinum TaxID=374426 RepID=A0ABU0HSN2_9HYPH|nr:hypothetical protein [Methylobacterium persicinum]MDQ0445344.1 putative membrane protein YhiD involved in acid resistance [Methylobacterium persicinum]GJE40279.1 hypothetical protein KHHGKMAE_4370 [Methylobacterium persicinum]
MLHSTGTDLLSRPEVHDHTTIAPHWLTASLGLVLTLIGIFLENVVPKGAASR